MEDGACEGEEPDDGGIGRWLGDDLEIWDATNIASGKTGVHQHRSVRRVL